MSVYHRSSEKRRVMQEYHVREEEIAAVLGRQMSPTEGPLEQDKKMRREIANSNERRRMQSINAGFQSLRAMIPHHEGEKLSKSAILQQTTDYIHHLQQEKAKVLAQNSQFKRLLGELSRRCNVDLDLDVSLYGSPPTKRKKRDTESSDEGITSDYDDVNVDAVRREMMELRQQLEQERRLRKILEEQTRAVEQEIYTNHVSGVPDHLTDAEEPSIRLCRPDVKPDSMSGTRHRDQEADQQLPASPQPCRPETADSSSSSSSMSRRNLETIVEAIRHLEGRNVVMEDHRPSRPIAHSEESERESGIMSDPEDGKSDSSGRDSPSPSRHYIQNIQSYVSVTQETSPASGHNSYHTKYPIVTNVLHGNLPKPQYCYRPGVIVQKS